MLKPILFNTDMIKAIMDGRKTVTRRLFKLKYRDDESGFQVVTTMSGKFVRVEKLSENGSAIFPDGSERFVNPPFSAGDILYVRETWCKGKVAYGEETDGRCVPFISQCPGEDDIIPKELAIREGIGIEDVVWKPSIFMPKEAARIFLRVKDVRVERLQAITDEDAIREGIVRMFDHLSDAEYAAWGNKAAKGMAKTDWPWNNYLWHGDFGKFGLGSRKSDAWQYQRSGYDSPRDSFSSLWNLTVNLKDWDTYGWDANPWVWVIEFERISKEEAGCV